MDKHPNKPRSYLTKVSVIDKLQKRLGLSDEQLALKAGVSIPTVTRALRGGPSFIKTIKALARALNATVDEILESDALPEDRLAERRPEQLVSGEFKFQGVVLDAIAPSVLTTIATKISEIVHHSGIHITSLESRTTLVDLQGDAVMRIIVFFCGWLASGRPFWAFVAIKPSRYEDFQTAQEAEAIDLYNFSSYGEIIVSGDTDSPPDDVLLLVSRQYNLAIFELDRTVSVANEKRRPRKPTSLLQHQPLSE
jgi:transcriptional regulator with XRE-family HTH domain